MLLDARSLEPLILNESASFVLRLVLEGELARRELALRVAVEYSVAESIATRDVESILEEFDRRGLLVE